MGKKVNRIIQQLKWKPDKNFPRQTFDIVTGLGLDGAIEKRLEARDTAPSKFLGPDFLGSWQWINDDTISWSLTENSSRLASRIGVETGGFIDVDLSLGGTPYLTLYRDIDKTDRVIPDNTPGSFDLRTSPMEFEETKESGGTYYLLFLDATTFARSFYLLNEENALIAEDTGLF